MEYLTITEVAKLTSENTETLKKRCQNNEIEGATKKGKTWLIPASYVPGLPKRYAGVYIDGANILHGAMEAGLLFDYKGLIDFIKNRYNISVLSFYDSVGYEFDSAGQFRKDSKGDPALKQSQLNFFNFLKGQGYRVVSKPLKYIDGDRNKPKNNMDSYMTLDIIKELQQWDVLILLSGDSDFDRLLDDVIASGKEIKIFSFSNRLSYELRTKAFNSPLVTFTKIEDLKGTVVKPKSSPF